MGKFTLTDELINNGWLLWSYTPETPYPLSLRNEVEVTLPILEEVSNLVDVKIAKVNIEENDKLVKEYKITSLPTLKLIKDNQLIATKIGMVSKSQLLSFIKLNVKLCVFRPEI